MVLLYCVVINIIEGFEKFDRVFLGVVSDYILFYVLEIKYYVMRVEVNENFEMSIENIFVVGDGVGLSRDIVNVVVIGFFVVRGIFKKEGFYIEKDFRKLGNWKSVVEFFNG